MAYGGKYIDRNPTLKAAGVPVKLGNTTAQSLQVYSREEAAEALILAKCQNEEKLKRNRHLPHYPYIPTSTIKDLLTTELKKSHFDAFREKFAENLYFKKAELGKVFQTNSKPDSVTNYNTTFGYKYAPSEALYGLVLPKKTASEVNREYGHWHNQYITSHSHYFPGEKINRHYDPKSFSPDQAFGIKTPSDITGMLAKSCMNQSENLIVISDTQKRFLDKHSGSSGNKSLKKDITYGRLQKRDECDVKALIEIIDPCVNNSVLVDAIAHINKLRHRIIETEYHINDLKAAFEKADPQLTGHLPLSKIFEVSRAMQLRMQEDKMRIILKHFNLIVDEGLETERMNYEQLLQMLQIQFPLRETGNLSTQPVNVYIKDTEYRDMCKDRSKKPNELAMCPMKRRRPQVDKTNAKDVIAPDIIMHFGLGPSDFEVPRCKEVLRKIFQRILTDQFDMVWERARQKVKPANDLMSVNELRKVMNDKEEGWILKK